MSRSKGSIIDAFSKDKGHRRTAAYPLFFTPQWEYPPTGSKSTIAVLTFYDRPGRRIDDGLALTEELENGVFIATLQ